MTSRTITGKLTDAQKHALEWLATGDWKSRSSNFLMRAYDPLPGVLDALVRKGWTKSRGGVGRPGIRLPKEWRITEYGRLALKEPRHDI